MLTLLVAKRVWLIIASLYYFSFLFTVGGYYFNVSIPGLYQGTVTIEDLSMITFHLYSLLVISTAWVFYSICEYIIEVYIPKYKWLIIIPVVIASSFALMALMAHLGIIVK